MDCAEPVHSNWCYIPKFIKMFIVKKKFFLVFHITFCDKLILIRYFSLISSTLNYDKL